MARTPSSGGYGNPTERDPGAVVRDVMDGLISPEAAAEHYGVAIAPDGRVDWRRASELRAER